MVEELKSAISHLASERPQLHLVEALRSLAVCHQVFIRESNADGFQWSSIFTSGMLTRLSFSITRDSSCKFYSFLITSCCYTRSPEMESPEALAAFFVATRLIHSAQDELAIEWLMKSQATAKSQLLRYEVSYRLSQVFYEQRRYEKALTWLGRAREDAASSELVVTEYVTGVSLLGLGEVESARDVLARSFGLEMFSQAMSCMLDAEVKYHESSGTSRCELIAAYVEGRRLLVNWCMPCFETKLAQFTSSDCCPQRFLIEFLELDGFSSYLNRELGAVMCGETTGEPAIQLSSSVFAYRLYCHGRKRIIELQRNVPAEEFMDPRPHLEEALDEYWHQRVDLDSLVLCQQISLKAAGHMTCFHLAVELLELLKGGIESRNLFSEVSSSFAENSSDGEVPEAWAAYFVSGAAMLPTRSRSYNTELLEKSVDLATTPTLRAMSTLALGTATHQLDKKLALLERAKEFAMESGHHDLIIQAMFHSFDALQLTTKYGQMHQLQERVCTLQADRFPRSVCMQALLKCMEGTLEFLLYTYSMESRGYEDVTECLALVASFGLAEHPEVCYRYFRSSESDEAPSSIQHYYMYLFYDCARQQVEYCQPRFEGSTENFGTLFHSFKCLVREEKLEEAEEAGASLLEKEKHVSEVLILLVVLCGMYYKRDYRQSTRRCVQVEETVAAVMDSFVAAALASDDSTFFTIEALWHHSVALDSLGWLEDSICKMEDSMKIRLQEDANFESFSSERIRYLDKRAFPRFQKLQLALFQTEDAERSLIWSERQRTRDFTFSLRRTDENSYLKQLVEFDVDDDKALEVIRSAVSVIGQETVALVINQYKTEPRGSWMYLTYFVHPTKLLVRYQEVRAKDLAFGARDIHKLVNGDCMNDVSFINYFQTLHEMLLQPFTAEFESYKPRRIIFIPSKEMSTVPFSLLLDRATGQFLIQQYAIATVSSLRLLRHCEMRKTELDQQARQRKPSLLVVGDPTHDLQSASEEAYFVARLLEERTESEVVLLHQRSATKEAVLESLPSSDWIHIASHAVVDEEFPDGALLLASNELKRHATETLPPEEVIRALKAAEDSEKLLGDEIAVHCGRDMKARGAVLSACTSGVGRQSAEGILALPRSFHLCGVPSMIVSLWPVDDQSTGKLMQLLYTRLTEGEEIVDALRLAMVEMLEEEDDFFGEPVYSIRQWAPFVLSGCSTTKLPL